eukprot:GSMAST32.ASY1.ANO1.913.1 assembled CDS
MDNTAKLWDVETGKEIHTLLGHTAEIVSLNFNTTGDNIITGWLTFFFFFQIFFHYVSFDHTVKVWDIKTGRCINTLAGHHGEISSTQFNFAGDLCISGSIDRTCKIWDVATYKKYIFSQYIGRCVQTLRGHNDEILDVCFNETGSKLVTASADGTSRVYNSMTGACQAILIGHEGEISKGDTVITGSKDNTCRIWKC